ncbi:MAG: DUF805 domain-containing protein [Alphaproteobacteria bacterium]|nr:DUF805 domain-containing protein [Alphaproteobacteria bacterium]
MNTSPEQKLAYQKRLNRELKELFVLTRGRIHRADYFLMCIMIKGVDEIMALIPEEPVWWLIIAIPLWILSFYIGLCAMTKRLRDIGLSGWMLIPAYLFIGAGFIGTEIVEDMTLKVSLLGVMLIPFIILLFWPPQRKDNKYGPYDEFSIFNGAGAYNKKKANKPQGE